MSHLQALERQGIIAVLFVIVLLQVAALAFLYTNAHLIPFTMAESFVGLMSWRLGTLIDRLRHPYSGNSDAHK